MNPLGAALVGLRVGRRHAEAYAQLTESTLVAICDSHPERLRAVEVNGNRSALRIQVRLFSHLRLSIGKPTLFLDLPDQATVGTVVEQLRRLVDPDVEGMIVDRARGGYRLVGLVNGRRAATDTVLRDGDVVSLLPPLGGG